MKPLKTYSNTGGRKFTISLDEKQIASDDQKWSFIYEIRDSKNRPFELQLVVMKSFFSSESEALQIAKNEAVVKIEELLESEKDGAIVFPFPEIGFQKGWVINPVEQKLVCS